MTSDINISQSHFSQASTAYKNTAKMQRGGMDSALEQVTMPGETSNRMEPSFQELVKTGLENAKNAEYKGESISAKALAGKAEYHQLVTAISNAELTLRTVVSIRDRMISAYQDIVKMPI